VTLQVLGVFLAGIYLGPVWGAASLVLYLAAGAVGAPVFQGGSAGVGQLVGQSAGYLWSYPVAAAAIGRSFTAARRSATSMESESRRSWAR